MWNKRFFGLFLLIGIVAAGFSIGFNSDQAQALSNDISWSFPINISNSETTSTDPFLLADPAGKVHLFWAEKLNEVPSNQPDTVLYTQWSDGAWSKPIDIFFAPLSDGTPVIGYPHAVIDQNGEIHLIWLSEPNFPDYAVNYSSVHSNQTLNVQAWKSKRVLADDLSGTAYSIDIEYVPPQSLHVVFARGAQGDAPREARAVSYMRSMDGGLSWSEPVDLFTVPVINWGTSHTRIIFQPPSNLYVSWTVWDEKGNGRMIYFTRSEDLGMTWGEPTLIAEKKEGEYERDWNSLVWLEENRIMAMWEGGFRAYRHAQYSDDGGRTWSEAIDTFPNLIGENGFAEFARDSNNTLHLFIAQRYREGSVGAANMPRGMPEDALWHSVWLGEYRWRDPAIANSFFAMINPKVVIALGNQVFATWYAPPTYEILVMTGKIEGAPPVSPVRWEEPSRATPGSSEQLPQLSTEIPLEYPPMIQALNDQPIKPIANPGIIILIGLAPVLVLISLYFIIRLRMGS